ncbi:MAG: tetratricopeptide repeat protein [Acidobacteria bacterium]|nr:tetratricopeptide repeat protein [Acidobacteriota bacterium]
MKFFCVDKLSRRLVVTACLLQILTTPAAAQGDFQKGISYYKQGQYAKAIEEFEELVQANPKYEDGFRILGDCYLKTRRYDKAASAFQNAIRLKDGNIGSYYGLALAYFNSGNNRGAASTLVKAEQFARAPREKFQLYRTRGTAYFNLREFSNAASDLEKAISIQRGSVSEYLQLGIAHRELGNYSEAEKNLRQALAMDPGSAEAKEQLSQIELSQAQDALEAKDFRKAAQLLGARVARNPEDAAAWYQLGIAHLFSENLKASEQAFLQAAKLQPSRGDTFNRLGYIYEKNRQYNKALQYYRKAHIINPDARTKESVERVQEHIRRQKQSS